MCRLSVAVCNSKQIWHDDKCKCECREVLVDKIVCDKGHIWNSGNCACECDKSCGISQYLDYKSCVCRNSLVDKLIEECTSVINEDKICNKILTVTSSNDCASCTLYIVLFAVFLSTSVIISGTFVYFYWCKNNVQLKQEKNTVHVKFNPHAQTTTY